MLVGSNAEPDSPYCQPAPGLYPGEIALRLDSGHYVAVDVQYERIETGEGAALLACARWIDGTGQTKTDAADKHIEGVYPHSVKQEVIEKHGMDAIRRAMLLAVLGEEPELVDIEAPVDLPALDISQIPVGTILEPAKTKAPILDLSPEVRRSVSIREAIKLAAVAPLGDVAALLDL